MCLFTRKAYLSKDSFRRKLGDREVTAIQRDMVIAKFGLAGTTKPSDKVIQETYERLQLQEAVPHLLQQNLIEAYKAGDSETRFILEMLMLWWNNIHLPGSTTALTVDEFVSKEHQFGWALFELGLRFRKDATVSILSNADVEKLSEQYRQLARLTVLDLYFGILSYLPESTHGSRG